MTNSGTLIQLQVTVNQSYVEPVEDCLNDRGALAITLGEVDEAIFNENLEAMPLWQITEITALFSTKSQALQAKQQLHRQLDINQDITISTLDNIDWQQQWQQQFAPITIANRLTILPFADQTTDNATLSLLLEPGLAFGTGNHPTTKMCLTWLATHDISHKTLVDFGCGSGILALAALRLGAKHCVAIDHDPQALLATQQNLSRNGLSPSALTVGQADIAPIETADILIANILCNPLVSLAPLLQTLLKANGLIVLSGILVDQIDTIVEAYQPWCHFNEPIVQDEWVCMTGTKIVAKSL